MNAHSYRTLQAGDHAPWFRQANTSNPQYAFDTAGGRYLLLCFFGSAGAEPGRRRLAFALEHRQLFKDDLISFFGVSLDPQDQATGRVAESLPGIRHFWDFDGRASRLYGALPAAAAGVAPDTAAGTATEGAVGTSPEVLRPQWVLLNPNLQVRAVFPFAADGCDTHRLLETLISLPPLERFGGMEMHAPVIQLPDIFEPGFCQGLIAEHGRQQRELTGFMREQGGKTVGIHDPGHKVRRDFVIEDEALRRQIQLRISRKVAAAIQRIHCFEANRMERYLVGCYDSEDGGHFRPHRDNTTRGTAHRRFALSVNLNDDFDGGDLVFPEYGPRRYKPPAGAGVVFSCSLLHAVVPVRRGRRYAFLPFLYDDKAAAVREANSGFLAQEGERYRAGPE